MTQPQTAAHEQLKKGSDEIGLFDVLIVLARHKKRLLLLPLVAAVLSAGISMVMPNVYEASTTLLPPQQGQSSAAALLSQLGGLASMGGAAGGLKSSNDIYIGMLKSQTVANKLIAKFDLKKVYDTDSLEIARTRLEKSTTIGAGKDGLISIKFEDRDKKLVAPLTNAYVSELFQLTKVLAVTEASQRRLFYEQQLEQAKNNLAKVEGELKNSLESRGVISVDTESRAVLETVGRLRAQASAKEIQLNSMAAFVTQDNPQYKQVQEELVSLRAELSKLENGRSTAADSKSSAPGARHGGLENTKLLRDVKYYQMLYELLAKQYEVARLDEAKDSSVLQVLDPAVEPERKSKPRRAIIIVLSTLIAFILAVVSAFVSDFRSRFLRSEQGVAQWHELKSVFGKK